MNTFNKNGNIERDKYNCKRIIETYKIASNGGLILLEESEETWTEKKCI